MPNGTSYSFIIIVLNCTENCVHLPVHGSSVCISITTAPLRYVCVIDQAPGQYRPIHARTAQAWGHVSSTVLPGCLVNNTFITRTARLPTLFPFSFFLLLYLGSKSGPYRVILDRLSGQYREIWTGLGCRGLASCMTTVTCRVIIMCTQHVYSSNDSLTRPKFLFVRYHVQGGTRIEGGCTWRKPLMKNMCSACGYCL